MLVQIRRFLSYSLFGALTSLVGFLTVPYLTRAMSPDDFGVVGIFMSILYFIGPSLSLSSESLVGINKAKLQPSDYPNFINQYITLLFTTSAIVALVCVPLSLIFDHFQLFILALPVVALLRSLARVHSIELVQERQPNWFGWYNLLNAVCLFCVSYIAISILNFSWNGRIGAIVLTELVFIGVRKYLNFYSLANYRCSLSFPFIVELATFGGPLFLMLVASWILNESDRFIVLKMISLADVGVYTAAYSIGMAVNVVNSAMINAAIPTIYAQH